MTYSFGTNETAASRLHDVAEFFNPRSAEFVSQHVIRPAEPCLDLGCGPGFSTDMVARALGGRAVYGIDNSAQFLDMARQRYPQYSFIEHDVTRCPFPVPARLMYVRFLLSHLQDVVGLVNGWLGELLPGGALFIEELEAIDTEIAVFQRYLQITESMLRAQATELFVGRILATGAYAADVVHNDCLALPVPNFRAARWFFLNAAVSWEKSPFLRETVSLVERRRIADELGSIKESGDTRSGITWKMRRLVLRQ